MGELLEFPSPQAQGLAFLDRQIRELLSAKGADDELADYAARQLRDIYSRINSAEQYRFVVHLPEGVSAAEREQLQADIAGGLERMRRDNHRLLVELVAELVLTQMQRFDLARR